MQQKVMCDEKDAPAFLNIGDVVFLANEEKAWTILGSCVSVCLHSKLKNVSAICHAQLPEIKGDRTVCLDNHLKECKHCKMCLHENKYMDKVLPFMIRIFEKNGIPARGIEAIIVGASVSIGNLSLGRNVGLQNIAMARKILSQHNIRIVNEETGGTGSTRVLIDNAKACVVVNKTKIIPFK